MKRYFLLFILQYSIFILSCDAQNNKMGNTWIVGYGMINAEFDGTLNMPITKQYITGFCNPCIYAFGDSHSNICDSSTGKIVFTCNSMRLFDTLGNIIENGDSLQPGNIYNNNNPPHSINNQGSLILPKGSDGLYYVFTPSVTDTTYTKFKNSTIKFPYDLLQYHVVDMKANGGMGKVIQKNIPLIENNEINNTGMMAVRHANGYDWWLLKEGFDTNKVYTFLVTKDTVLLDTIQYTGDNHFGYNGTGQSCFSADGSKYAMVKGLNSKLFLADFDRCYGILSNPKIIKTPIDSNTHPFYILDSINTGVCFSSNNKYIYLTQDFHVYQYEYDEPDSTLAWYKVIRGADTTLQQFGGYSQLYRGIDNRIYIGKYGGTGTQNSVIDYPDLKGSACGFCRKCLRCDTCWGYTSTPPNMPDFNLGAKTCYPEGLLTPLKKDPEPLNVFPNPSSTLFYIHNKKGKKKELFNCAGVLVFSTTKDEIEVSRLAKGFYYILCEGASKKVIVE